MHILRQYYLNGSRGGRGQQAAGTACGGLGLFTNTNTAAAREACRVRPLAPAACGTLKLVGAVPGAGCRVLGAGCWVLGAGCWVLGAGCRVLVQAACNVVLVYSYAKDFILNYESFHGACCPPCVLGRAAPSNYTWKALPPACLVQALR